MSEKEKSIVSTENNAEETYNKVRSSVITAQSHIYCCECRYGTGLLGDRRADLPCLRRK